MSVQRIRSVLAGVLVKPAEEGRTNKGEKWKRPSPPLEAADRHVREGEERVARQRALIAELERDTHPALLPVARALLAELEAALRWSQENLRREEDHAKTGVSPGHG